MKKVLLMVVLALLPMVSHAQLQVKSKTTREVLWKDVVGRIELVFVDPVYFISTNTTNQFDDSFVFILGHNQQQSLMTLFDLQDLIEKLNKKETITAKNGNHECQISKFSRHSLAIFQDNYAGFATITDLELDSMIDAMQGMKRNKE